MVVLYPTDTRNVVSLPFSIGSVSGFDAQMFENTFDRLFYTTVQKS